MDAEAISKHIQLRGENQEEVAKAVEWQSALSMYENGSRIPRDEIKIRIASITIKVCSHF